MTVLDRMNARRSRDLEPRNAAPDQPPRGVVA